MPGFKKRKKKQLYLDYASATPVHPQALAATQKAFAVFANPGGIHSDSVAAKQFLQKSRERIAAHLGCKPRELIFTSGLTEGNNIAIVGAARALERARRSLSGTHWITTSIEHSSVLECFSEVERLGGTVTHVEPEESGIVPAAKIAAALRPETVFVSVGWANNEIGTVQPLATIARAIRVHEKKHKTKILFHSDAGQAPLYLSPQVHTLGLDAMSLGSGKLYGPRGVGALFVAGTAELAPVIFGGGQEKGLRSGTEDVALAAGFAEAFDIITPEKKQESNRLKKIRDDFAREIRIILPDIIINGDMKEALPHILNISVPGEKTGEYLVLQLDHAGISLSTKSACREGEADSHVVAALGGPARRARNTLRFSLGIPTDLSDTKHALEIIREVLGSAGAI